MTSRDITDLRLVNQQINVSTYKKPAELLRWMGCIQAQDFAAAKWALGTRITGLTDAEIGRDYDAGKILRTHVLRPTWHFVSPDDIIWMLKLTAPRIKAMSKTLHRKLGMDDVILKRSKKIIREALKGGAQLTRGQLLPVFKKKNINTDDIRLGFFLMDAELDGIICSGAKQGNQFTYALLEERVSNPLHLEKEDAIAELAKRYFLSRGPATIPDFSWWSGLNLADSKRGLEMNKSHLINEEVNGQAYWFSSGINPVKLADFVNLLPSFDEYAIAYKDRADILLPSYRTQTGNGIFKPSLIVNGQIQGTWTRSFHKEQVQLEIMQFNPLNMILKQKMLSAAKRYSHFLGKELSLSVKKIGKL